MSNSGFCLVHLLSHQSAALSSSVPPAPPSAGPPLCRAVPPGRGGRSGRGKGTEGGQQQFRTVAERFMKLNRSWNQSGLVPSRGPAADTACRCPAGLCRNGWRAQSSPGRRCICSYSEPTGPGSPPPPPPLQEPRTGAERLTCHRKQHTGFTALDAQMSREKWNT